MVVDKGFVNLFLLLIILVVNIEKVMEVFLG